MSEQLASLNNQNYSDDFKSKSEFAKMFFYIFDVTVGHWAWFLNNLFHILLWKSCNATIFHEKLLSLWNNSYPQPAKRALTQTFVRKMFNVIELKWYYRCSSVGRTLEEFKTSVTVAAHKKITFELTYEELLKRRLGKYELQIHARPMQPVRDFKVSLCWWSYYQPLWSKLAMAFIWMLFSMSGWRAH